MLLQKLLITLLLSLFVVASPLHGASVTEALCRLDVAERVLTEASLKASALKISAHSLESWKKYESGLRNNIQRNIAKNHKRYRKAYESGHPHVRFMVEEWGVRLGKKPENVKVPSIAAFFKAYYRRIAEEIEAGAIKENDVIHPVRVFFKEYDLVSVGHSVPTGKTKLNLDSNGLAISSPALINRLIKDGKIRSASDLRSIELETLVPRELVFVRYGEEVPEGAIPWPSILGDLDYASLVASGGFPLGEPGELLRNGKDLTPAEHDLGHFSGFLEKDCEGELTYLKNFKIFAARMSKILENKSLVEEAEEGKEVQLFLFVSEYVIDAKPISKDLLGELFPITKEKTYAKLSDSKLRALLHARFVEMPDKTLNALYRQTSKQIWQLMSAYGGAVRDLFSYPEGYANLLTKWEYVERSWGKLGNHFFRAALAEFQYAYLVQIRNEVSVAEAMNDFLAKGFNENKKLKKFFCTESGPYEKMYFCR